MAVTFYDCQVFFCFIVCLFFLSFLALTLFQFQVSFAYYVREFTFDSMLMMVFFLFASISNSFSNLDRVDLNVEKLAFL